MFGSNVLEVAIGLVFVYLLLSLLCSTINEQVIARFFALRAKTLEDGIKNMLNDPEGNVWVNRLYETQLIKGLSQPGTSNKPRKPSQSGTSNKLRKPSYIPADIFALSLVSVIQAYKNDPSAANSPTTPEALKLFIKQVHDDPAKEELANIEKWFNATMDRVSGWYKRRVQLIIFALGFVIVVGLNIDTISLITSLSNDTVIRATIVSAAQGYAKPNTDLGMLETNIEQFQPVIGWPTSTGKVGGNQSTTLPADFEGWILKIVGLLATVFAVSLGAPFWFDVLNKFTSFRSSGSPPQTSTGTAWSTGARAQLVAKANVSPNTATQPVISTVEGLTERMTW